MTQVEDYLAEHEDLDVIEHFVWLPMFPRIAENAALPDAVAQSAAAGRVHYWDGAQKLGRSMRGMVPDDVTFPGLGEVLWDAFLVFDAEATWATAGDHVLASGATIMEDRATLFAMLDTLHTGEAPAPVEAAAAAE